MLDPIQDKPWSADYVTDNQQQFLDVVWSSRECDVFVDEAGEMIGHFDKLMVTLATRGRHFKWHTLNNGESVYGGGHNCYFIAQRAHMMSPAIRTQCRKLFAFNQDLDDCKALKAAWGRDELLQCATLPQGSYIYAERFKGVQFGRVF